MNLDIDVIRRLVQLIDKSGVTEFEYEDDSGRIYISKKHDVVAASPVSYTPQVQQAAPQITNTPDSSPAPAKPSESDNSATILHEIKSPIVGTFYRAPAPDAESYCKVGDRVTQGQTLCIVEAMKLMNEIESDVSGTIVKILVDNAKPVEYGQALFLVKPD